METIKWLYRSALIGFMLFGGIGAYTTGDNSSLADTPAIWTASNAITNAFQGGLLGMGVGLVIVVVLAVRHSRARKSVMAPMPLPAPVGP